MQPQHAADSLRNAVDNRFKCGSGTMDVEIMRLIGSRASMTPEVCLRLSPISAKSCETLSVA